ncbi:MFS transporter [Aeribacillus composti]|uniref:MFS transporter n=1 Tax=Aeribacillus composti TaxID=1868734 RepID=UPI002E1FC850|nr:MFS transporter [Aeribacillus composti]
MERLWTKSFLLITTATLFLFTAFYMLYPTLPPFIKQIGGNESLVGWATGVFMLSAVLVRPLVGGLLDRFGRRPFLLGGVLLFAAVMYGYSWIGGIAVLLALRTVHGVSWAVSTTSMLTAAADMIPPTRRGEGMGWFGTAMTVAMAVGPMIGLAVAKNTSYQGLFLFATFLSVLAFVLLIPVDMPFQRQREAKRIDFWEPSVLPVAVSVIFLFLAYGGITTFVPLFAESIHVNSGLFFLVYAAALMLSRPLAGKLSDRRGEAAVIGPALATTVLALLLLSISKGWVEFFSAAVLFGIGFGSAQPALQAAMIRMARPDRIGVANATFTTATDLGIGFGAILFGWISTHMGYSAVFRCSALAVVVSFVVFIVFRKRMAANDRSRSLTA